MNTQAKSWVRILLVMAVVAMMLACIAGASAALRAGDDGFGMKINRANLAVHIHGASIARKVSRGGGDLAYCPMAAAGLHHRKCSDPPHLYGGRG